jgi:ABC-type dipeptide/oligopeptide/nickel transport system permease subunit
MGLGIVCVFSWWRLRAARPPLRPKTDSSLTTRSRPPSEDTVRHDSLGRDILVRVVTRRGVRSPRDQLGDRRGVPRVLSASRWRATWYGGRTCDHVLHGHPARLSGERPGNRDRRHDRPGLRNSLLAISTVAIPIYAAIAGAPCWSSASWSSCTAGAKAFGGSAPHVVLRHIFPNSLPPLTVQTTLAIAFAILEAAALGFLGLGPSRRRPSGARCWPTRTSTSRPARGGVLLPRQRRSCSPS